MFAERDCHRSEGQKKMTVTLESCFVVVPPTGPLVSDPAALTEFPCKMSVDGGSVVAIVSNVKGVEVVLQEIVGHFDWDTVNVCQCAGLRTAGPPSYYVRRTDPSRVLQRQPSDNGGESSNRNPRRWPHKTL